jgi:hypothetical protein
LPETREVEDFWVETLERVDQKKSAAKPKPTASVDSDPGDARDAAQIIADEGAELVRQGDSRLERVFKRRERPRHTVQELLQLKRWRQLIRHPEWRERVIAVYSLQSALTPERYGGGARMFAAAAHRLLEQSNATFGDWRKQRLR